MKKNEKDMMQTLVDQCNKRAMKDTLQKELQSLWRDHLRDYAGELIRKWFEKNQGAINKALTEEVKRAMPEITEKLKRRLLTHVRVHLC